MKKPFLIATAVFWALFLLTAFAVQMGNAQPKGPMKYNTETVETLEGKIMEVQTETCKMGSSGQGIHLLVKTSSELVTVHLGPERFINKQKPNFKVNDVVSITGSRVRIEDKDAIIAAKLVIKSGEEISLRTEDGIPLWRRQGKGKKRAWN